MLDSRYPEDAEKALATLRLRASQSCAAWAPAQAIRGLGVGRDEGSLDLRLVPPHPAALASPEFAVRGEPAQRDKGPPDVCLGPLHPWIFRSRSGTGDRQGCRKVGQRRSSCREVPVTEPMDAKRITQFPVFSMPQLSKREAWRYVRVPHANRSFSAQFSMMFVYGDEPCLILGWMR